MKRQRVQTTPQRSNAGNIHVKRPRPKRSDAGNIHVKRPKVTRARIDEEAAPEMTVNCRAKAVAQTAMEFRSSDGPASKAEIFVKTYRIRSTLRVAIGCEFQRTLARAFT